MLIGYARISRGEEQNNALQIQALKQAGVGKIFEESASGARWDRPILHKMLDRYPNTTQFTHFSGSLSLFVFTAFHNPLLSP